MQATITKDQSNALVTGPILRCSNPLNPLCSRPCGTDADGVPMTRCNPCAAGQKRSAKYWEAKTKKTRRIVELDSDSSDTSNDGIDGPKLIQSNGTVPQCMGCTNPSRLMKGSSTVYTKYCDECSDANSTMFKAVQRYINAKRKFGCLEGSADALIQEHSKIQDRMNEIKRSLEDINELRVQVTDSKRDLDALMTSI